MSRLATTKPKSSLLADTEKPAETTSLPTVGNNTPEWMQEVKETSSYKKAVTGITYLTNRPVLLVSGIVLAGGARYLYKRSKKK